MVLAGRRQRDALVHLQQLSRCWLGGFKLENIKQLERPAGGVDRILCLVDLPLRRSVEHLKCKRSDDPKRGTVHFFYDHSRKCACGDYDVSARQLIS